MLIIERSGLLRFSIHYLIDSEFHVALDALQDEKAFTLTLSSVSSADHLLQVRLPQSGAATHNNDVRWFGHL